MHFEYIDCRGVCLFQLVDTGCVRVRFASSFSGIGGGRHKSIHLNAVLESRTANFAIFLSQEFKTIAENEEPQLQNKRGRLTTLRVSNEAENGEPQLHNKRGRLTSLCVSNEAENGEP